MQADVGTHYDNHIEMAAPFSLSKTQTAVRIAYRKPEWLLWRNRRAYQARCDWESGGNVSQSEHGAD